MSVKGLLRSHQAIGGRRVDMLLYAVLRDDATEWPATRITLFRT